MDIPLYTQNNESSSSPEQDYNQQLNAILSENIGGLGFNVTPITSTDLLTTPILNPNTGTFSTTKDLAQVGAMFFLTDLNIWVGKQSAGPTVLQQFSTINYP